MRSGRRLEIAPEADDDLRAILADSLAVWGEWQPSMYAGRLASAYGDLQAHPHLGRSRDDVSPGVRALPVGQHVIDYRVDEQMVTILRLLQERMEPARHLDPP
jgi:toxin ParE1/3/4